MRIYQKYKLFKKRKRVDSIPRYSNRTENVFNQLFFECNFLLFSFDKPNTLKIES